MPTNPEVGQRWRNQTGPFEVVAVLPTAARVTYGPWGVSDLLLLPDLQQAVFIGAGEKWQDSAFTVGDVWRTDEEELVRVLSVNSTRDQIDYVGKGGQIRTIPTSEAGTKKWERVGPGWGTDKRPAPEEGQRWRTSSGSVVELIAGTDGLRGVWGPKRMAERIDLKALHEYAYLGRGCVWLRTAILPGSQWFAGQTTVTVTEGYGVEVYLQASGGWSFRMWVDDFLEHFKRVPKKGSTRYKLLMEEG